MTNDTPLEVVVQREGLLKVAAGRVSEGGCPISCNKTPHECRVLLICDTVRIGSVKNQYPRCVQDRYIDRQVDRCTFWADVDVHHERILAALM